MQWKTSLGGRLPIWRDMSGLVLCTLAAGEGGNSFGFLRALHSLPKNPTSTCPASA